LLASVDVAITSLSTFVTNIDKSDPLKPAQIHIRVPEQG
jgi:hypothetical protein